MNNIKIPFEFSPRREGDLASFYADSQRAQQELGWVAELSLEDMLIDSWNWQNKNPNGYK